ncbi:hypothetical protein K7G98_28430 [Saccharothrix sp. MB29]|nr:hypothetical protein [Saccharothrix sp. MB29]
MVVHEAWWNTSAKFADIVLPVATSLERDDFAAGFSIPTSSRCRRSASRRASRVPITTSSRPGRPAGFERSSRSRARASGSGTSTSGPGPRSVATTPCRASTTSGGAPPPSCRR